jgi:hypothetical protein
MERRRALERGLNEKQQTTAETEHTNRLFHQLQKKIRQQREYIQAQLLRFIRQNMVYALLVGLAAVAMSVPSLISMFYLVLLFIGLISPHHLFMICLPLAYLYSILYLSAQFVFNMPRMMQFFIYPSTRVILAKVGFREEEYKSVLIFGQMVLSLFMALNIRAHLMILKEQKQKTETSPLLVEKHELVEQAESSSDDTEDDVSDHEQPEDVEGEELDQLPIKTSPASPWKTFKRYMKSAWKRTKQITINLVSFIVNFLVRYSYNLSLVVLYFADLFLPNADILHAIYRKLCFFQCFNTL